MNKLVVGILWIAFAVLINVPIEGLTPGVITPLEAVCGVAAIVGGVPLIAQWVFQKIEGAK